MLMAVGGGESKNRLCIVFRVCVGNFFFFPVLIRWSLKGSVINRQSCNLLLMDNGWKRRPN